jgi:hypothetical protein
VEAFEDCASGLLVRDERDEFQTAAARARQGVDIVDALQELRPVDARRRLTNDGCGDILGSDGGRAIWSWLAARANTIGKVDDFTMMVVVVAAAAALA